MKSEKIDAVLEPIYDIGKTYLDNLENGPFFKGQLPNRKLPPHQASIDFLGIPLASPIGIPAGPLLDSKWVSLAASLGFDLLTYKTIRSYEHPSHPLPNILAVQTGGQLDPKNLPDFLEPEPSGYHLNNDSTGITNSFGNPSRSPNFLREDIARSNRCLQPGQALIVSIFGSTESGTDLLEDFVRTAIFAKECGAKLIEANYSCPNVSAIEGNLFSSPELVYTFSKTIADAIGNIPLIIKVGLVSDQKRMQMGLEAAARAGVRAVCGLNTISMKVVDKEGNPAMGPKRTKCGICGGPIRDAALSFTRMARKIIDKEQLDLKLMATGGITKPSHFKLFLNEGADIAMSATGMMWDPHLAMKYHELTRT